MGPRNHVLDEVEVRLIHLSPQGVTSRQFRQMGELCNNG